MYCDHEGYKGRGFRSALSVPLGPLTCEDSNLWGDFPRESQHKILQRKRIDHLPSPPGSRRPLKTISQ